ncbi:TPA: hypothetical protein DEB72_00535 [Patescibacteria group bacterium]|nr:hypothetical protein [Patescibacteria group bacterium]
MDYKDALTKKIYNLISGKWGVPEFEKEYYRYFLEQVPEGSLTLPQSTFYGLVQEKLDWTAESPNEQEKKDGWFNYPEYIEWLKINAQLFQENEEGWYKNHIRRFKN